MIVTATPVCELFLTTLADSAAKWTTKQCVSALEITILPFRAPWSRVRHIRVFFGRRKLGLSTNAAAFGAVSAANYLPFLYFDRTK